MAPPMGMGNIEGGERFRRGKRKKGLSSEHAGCEMPTRHPSTDVEKAEESVHLSPRRRLGLDVKLEQFLHIEGTGSSQRRA